MIRAVNNAAETARIVIDQAANEQVSNINDDTRSMSSHGSRRSVGSSNSIHSFNSSSMNGLGMGDQLYQIPLAGSGDTHEVQVSHGEDDNTNNKQEESFTSTETSRDMGTTPFSPPPANAFQNLPMMRGGFAPSHNKSSDSNNNVLAGDGKVFEVTSHFDAAAAISAALASSHLARASGTVVGELQKRPKLSKPFTSNFYPASTKRRSSNGDTTVGSESDLPRPPRPLSRAQSGGAAEECFAFLTKSEEGEGQGSPRRRSTGLPTPEEAEAEMLLKRTSFISVDDLSFGSDDAKLEMLMGAFASDRQSLTAEVDHLNETDSKGEGRTMVESSQKDEQVASAESTMANTKSGDSTSHCSSSGYENESNTSSVYGSNTNSGYSSDMSPISMSTGGDSGGGKQNGGSGGNNIGMLGNLANSRRVSLGETNDSYGGADDEYSTHSENSGLDGKHHPRKRSENKNGKAKTVTISPKSSVPVVGPMPKRNGVGPSNRKPQGMLYGESIQTDESNTSSAAKNIVYIVPSPKEKTCNLKKKLSVEQSRHAAPTHRVSLFNSFDRNWEQAVQDSENPEKVLSLGRKCFAAFAIVFGSCKDADGSPIFGDNTTNYSSDASKKSSTFRWWVDDNALTNAGDVMHGPNSAKEGAASEHEDDHQGIPIVVIRSLWKACFFDAEENANPQDDTDILDSIQHTLVKELCYLTATETPSASCLLLSLDVYAEYGWYILSRFAMQDQITCWHSKFSIVLRQILLDGSLADADSIIQRRYAAQSLPRHTAIGLLGVDSKGHLRIDATEGKRMELRTQLFDNLLCDGCFIKSRAELLGRGYSRPGDADETLNADGTNTQIAKLIKQIRDNDSNMLFSTMTHMKDIEWCASFCVPDIKEVNEPANQQNEKNESDASSFSVCLDAMTQWKEVLIATFRSLHDSGKLTICDKTAKELKVVSQSNDDALPANNHIAQLVSHYYDAHDGDSPGTQESCIEVAKSLLAKDDAWTMKDDSAQIFKEDSSKEFLSPRPPRKKGRKRVVQKEGATATTSLARILNIDINELRTSVTIGRSLLSIAEFSQYMLDKDIFDKDLKESSSVTSRLHGIQLSCLKNAIEVLSCSATTLGYILSSSLQKLDEDDLDETVTTTLGPTLLLQLFAMTREASKPLLSIAGILSADAWFSFGKLVKACELDATDHVMLSSFERARLILNDPKSISLNKPALDLLCESLLSPLTQYKCFLQSNINHSIGVCWYEQGDFGNAADYLDKSTRFRRQMLDDLRGQDDENVDNNGLSKLFNAVVGGMKSNYFVSPASMSEEIFENIFKYSITHTSGQLQTFAVDDLELSLSLTLEYAALTQHAGQKYQVALSLFQESLILRTMHVGKHSLDVASLHFNMGVVYDDLELYDQAISRYHESLRIRLDQMNKATSQAVISELEDSVLLTLKCMGHVYKLINDVDNAICCYAKALEMVNKTFQTYRDQSQDEWVKMGLHLDLAVPVPTVIFDEMKSITGNTSWKTHFQTMNKKELCHIFEPRLPTKRRYRSTVSKLKKELVKIHVTVIDLINERKQHAWDNESGSARSKLPGLSLLLASFSSTFKTGGDAFEAVLMRSSFCLGRMRLEQTRYEEAADHLETALRSKWVLDPASSSDSDSDFSRKSYSSRKHQAKCMDEDNPEEGQIYYALGICNAALDDHERAVRCFLTALRYLRRSLRKVDSLGVARVLFDCAISYYYLCNYEEAISLYGECLRILNSYDFPSNEENGEKTSPAKDDVSKSNSFRRGIVVYCLVMAKAAIDFDSEASNLLNEAQILLSSCNDKIILAYMEFLTGLFLYHAASQVPVRLRTITRISPTGLSLNSGISWSEMIQSALTLLEQVKNECWFDPMEGVEDTDEVKHLPLSGHICFKKGQLFELIDSVDQALNSYVDAANFYRIACGDENMYVASVLHRMGIICSQRTEYHALGYFNEALSIRKNLLGGNDHLVAETLYSSAIVLARLNRYEASMERYHEALRIQMADCQDSNEVARTLAGMGICHYNHRAYDLALTCLEGAVKIRTYRVSRLTDSTELVELYGEEVALGADLFNFGNVHMQMGDYTQATHCFIQSRDLRWRHVGSGTVDKILDAYFSERTVDEDELLGLAHCLHNIGVMFDIKKDYRRSLPHYEEALAIKNAIAGFSARDSMSLVDQVNPAENGALILQSLHKDHEFPRINNATLSASVTRQKIATVYVKQRKYDHALFHFSHALRIQRQVLGNDHFRVGSILSNMGNALRCASTYSETAILCYNESLRISRLRFGQNHVTVASAMFDIGSMYDSNRNFSKAMHYYQRALSVYRQKYSQELRYRLCSGLERPLALMNGGEGVTEIVSTGDEIIVGGDASTPEKQIREQYGLVTEALRKAKSQDMINRGERISCVGDSDDAWLTFEVLLFGFVEMMSTHIVSPAQTVVRDTINNSRRRIESAAAQAVVSAADALDYQFLLLLQE